MKKILTTILIILSCSLSFVMGQRQQIPDQRVIIFMLDGFGLEYLEKSDMPFLKGKMIEQGFYTPVKSMIPSVTNCNNTSICCGVAANTHGVVGNTFINNATGKKEFLERSELVLAPTIFQRAKEHNIKSALFSSKLKTISLLSQGTDLVVCPETATREWINVAGEVPSKYSREVNYWTLKCAIHTLENQTDIKLLYIHTTDYAMHTWKPEDKESQEHLFKIDSLIGEVIKVAPDAAIFVTADHGMNHKSQVWDLVKALKNRGIEIKAAISPLADKYPKHHSGYGGIAYVYLNQSADEESVKKALQELDGVEEVYSRSEAAKEFLLMPERIGDLVILGDKKTVFGELEDGEIKSLPENYRTHGSMYEQDIPLVIFNIQPIPTPSFFQYNKDIVRWLY